MDFGDLISITTLGNTDNFGCEFDYRFDTHDYFYLDSQHEAAMRLFQCNLGDKANLTFPTDYALLNKAVYFEDRNDLHAKLAINQTKSRVGCRTWLRTAERDVFDNDLRRVSVIDESGRIDSVNMKENILPHAIRPCVQLEIDACLAVLKYQAKQNKHNNCFALGMGQMNLGTYPTSYVGEEINCELEKKWEDGILKSTGKTYTGRYNNKRQCLSQYDEYEIDGEKYVRVDKGFKGNDGYWVKVEPIVWEIENWNDLPTALNPKGTNQADTIKLRTKSAIIAGIPFYPNTEDKYNHLWQNSTLRGYLNGYNVNYIQHNGSQIYGAPRGGNFVQQSFINEAMDSVIEHIRAVRFYGKKKFIPTIEANPNVLKNKQNLQQEI